MKRLLAERDVAVAAAAAAAAAASSTPPSSVRVGCTSSGHCVQSGINIGGETSQSEWSEEDEDGAASEPLLADRESTGYTTDDPALENISMLNETGLTDAEGNQSFLDLFYMTLSNESLGQKQLYRAEVPNLFGPF